MARGPFQGTWEAGVRPTVVTAPDALVYINGEQDILGCPSCQRRFDLSKYITDVQVSLNVDSAPGSASVSLSIPRHAVDKFFIDGNPLVTPMMEIEIYSKGYFLVEGVPQYYPIFWGLVTEVTDSYSAGEHTVSINCADILKWWELCRMNINPAFTVPAGQLGKNIFGNVFFGMNPYDIIWTLAQQAYGDVVIGSGSLTSVTRESSQRSTFNHALSDMMLYWQKRFSKIRSNLLLYGTRGNAVRGDVINAEYRTRGPGVAAGKGKSQRHPFASQLVRQANGGDAGAQMVFDPTDKDVVAFRTQFMQAGQVNFWSSEYETKLQLASAAKDAIGFEFYMDVTGDIVFKPPFYNLDILSNKPVSWIQDIDIIDWSIADSEAEVVTQIQIQGGFGGNTDYGMSEEVTPFTSVTDYHLLRKYGWRTQTFNSEFLGSPMLMFYTGMDMLDRYNSKRFNASVTIPMRPELRLGFPIYLASKDQIWYISGISHSLTFGGRATTTLSLTAKRSKFLAPQGIGTIEMTGYSGPKVVNPNEAPTANPIPSAGYTSKQLAEGARFKAVVGLAAETPPISVAVNGSAGDLDAYKPLLLRHPKTGRLVGYPNVVMAYTRPFQPTPNQLSDIAGKKRPGTTAGRSQAQAENEKALVELDQVAHAAQEDSRLREKYLNNRYQYGLNSAGVYTYLHDKSAVLQEFVILKGSSVDFDSGTSQVRFPNQSGMIQPVSDERGFEVIGHFRYGRGVSLRDGSLIINEDSSRANSRATIDTQLALSGDLFEILRAQSSGLTTVTTAAPNPAAAITSLVPEDLQTSGFVNPETGKPQFSSSGTNFMDVAPLGSAEQVGALNTGDPVSVEASQLSKALTIAEMSVKEDIIAAAECVCNLATSDLAFIASGYQLKYLGDAAEDASTIGLGGSSLYDDGEALSLDATLAIQQLNQERDAYIESKVREARERVQQESLADQNSGLTSTREAQIEAAEVSAADEAMRQFNADNAAAYEELGVDLATGEVSSSVGANEPVQDSSLSKALTPSRVEAFLADLYRALDRTHQQWEKALRGELIESPRRTSQDVRFGLPQDKGGISAPYDAGRQIGGDPMELAQMGAQAMEDLSNTWENFAADLASNAQRTLLEAEIRRLQEEAAELDEQIQATQAALDGGSAVIGPSPSIAQLQSDLDKVLIDLKKAQQDLNVLNATYPA